MDLIRRIAALENKVAHLERQLQPIVQPWEPDAKAYLEMTAYAAGAAFVPDDGQDVSHICPRDPQDDMA